MINTEIVIAVSPNLSYLFTRKGRDFGKCNFECENIMGFLFVVISKSLTNE